MILFSIILFKTVPRIHWLHQYDFAAKTGTKLTINGKIPYRYFKYNILVGEILEGNERIITGKSNIVQNAIKQKRKLQERHSGSRVCYRYTVVGRSGHILTYKK